MRITYRPARVRSWTSADLERLVGMLVIVNIRSTTSGGWIGDRGIVDRAGIARRGTPFVEFDHGSGYDWHTDDEVFMSVCDEHGDHTSLNGVDCVDRFMAEVTGMVKR